MRLALVTNTVCRIGSDHLPFEAIDTGRMPNMPQLTYGRGLVDEAMQWVRDRETGSVVSSDESSSALTGDSSGMGSSKPIDPNTLYFQKEDVIMLVEGQYSVVLCFRQCLT